MATVTDTTTRTTRERASAPGAAEPRLLCDGECPLCSADVRLVRLRESVGPLRPGDAREGGPVLDELRAAELSIDEGMALKLDGRLRHGDDCIDALALLSTPSGAFDRLNARVFRSPRRSRPLYPVLRRGRGLALAALGRRGIEAG